MVGVSAQQRGVQMVEGIQFPPPAFGFDFKSASSSVCLHQKGEACGISFFSLLKIGLKYKAE